MGPAITPAPVFELPAIIRKYVTEIHFPRESEAERLSRSKRARCGLVFNIIIAAVILVGVGLLAYPTVADYYNQYHSTRLIAGYSDVVAGMSEADFDTMRAEAEAYNQALFGNPARFQPDDAELARYNSILDVTGTGIMGYIEIPRINGFRDGPANCRGAYARHVVPDRWVRCACRDFGPFGPSQCEVVHGPGAAGYG